MIVKSSLNPGLALRPESRTGPRSELGPRTVSGLASLGCPVEVVAGPGVNRQEGRMLERLGGTSISGKQAEYI